MIAWPSNCGRPRNAGLVTAGNSRALLEQEFPGRSAVATHHGEGQFVVARQLAGPCQSRPLALRQGRRRELDRIRRCKSVTDIELADRGHDDRPARNFAFNLEIDHELAGPVLGKEPCPLAGKWMLGRRLRLLSGGKRGGERHLNKLKNDINKEIGKSLTAAEAATLISLLNNLY